MFEYIEQIALTVLFAVIKNPAKVAAMKKALRKLRDLLNTIPLD